jgi:ferric uptake regulator, Fur family
MDFLPKQKRSITVYHIQDCTVTTGVWGYKGGHKTNNRTIYEFVVGKQHHEHLICVECGKIIEFNKEEIEQLQEKVCEEYDFTPINHRLEIFGLCSDCKGKGRENRVG